MKVKNFAVILVMVQFLLLSSLTDIICRNANAGGIGTTFLSPQIPDVYSPKRIYMDYLKYCIKLNMRKARIFERHDFKMYIQIEKDGKISGYDIKQSSDSPEYDLKVLRTVIDTGSFRPFPIGINNKVLYLQIDFDGAEVYISVLSPLKMRHKVDKVIKMSKTVNIVDARMTKSSCSVRPSGSHGTLGIVKEMQIGAYWYPPLTYDNDVEISYRIDNLGRISGVKILHGSHKEAILAAQSAVNSVIKIYNPMAKGHYKYYITVNCSMFVERIGDYYMLR